MGIGNQLTSKGISRISRTGGLVGTSSSGAATQSPHGLHGLKLAWLNTSGRDDVLSTRNVKEVYAWYTRLAHKMAQKKVRGQKPLCSVFMQHYLSVKKDMPFESRELLFTAPDYLRNDARVIDTLKYHRRVYLTADKARIGKSTKWAGILPRWKNPGTYNWDKQSLLHMNYHCLVEMPLRLQLTGNDEEKDLLYALRGFQLKSEVTVEIKTKPASYNISVVFKSFRAWVFDKYDFDYNEYIKVPNPDYGRVAADAIESQTRIIRVYHKNARRLENAGLAAPFPLRSKKWNIKDPEICGEGLVDTRRDI